MTTDTQATEALVQHETPNPSPAVSPWAWVPLLYVMQAVPVTIVQELALVFFKDMGIGNEPITRWTSLIALPWSLQLLLGPLVDLNSTKRSWTLWGQAACAVGLIGAAFALRAPHAFELSLVILGATALCSALCNIATDGFYILAQSRESQAKFVGIQSTAYRLGRFFCVGVMIQAAGKLHDGGMDQMAAWSMVLAAGGGLYLLGRLIAGIAVPRPAEDQPAANQAPGENSRNVGRTFAVVALGVGGYFALSAITRLVAHGIWAIQGADPGGALKGWMLPAHGDLLGLPMPGITAEVVQLILSAVVAAGAFAAVKRTVSNTPMGDAFASFVRQPGIVPIFFFILFYRFGEAMMSKMTPLFLKDSISAGGLGIGNDPLGVIKGYAGVFGIIAGGILGGVLVGRVGLRRSILPLALSMHLPNLLYLLLSTVGLPLAVVDLGAYFGKVPLTLVGVDFVDQFGYGFGFAAYMVYIMYVAQRGAYRTAHMAIATGSGALCIIVAGIVSGIIQSNYGYPVFFVSVLVLSLPGLLTLFFIPLDEPRSSTPVAG